MRIIYLIITLLFIACMSCGEKSKEISENEVKVENITEVNAEAENQKPKPNTLMDSLTDEQKKAIRQINRKYAAETKKLRTEKTISQNVLALPLQCISCVVPSLRTKVATIVF